MLPQPKHKEYDLKRSFGMTIDQFGKLWENQQGRCVICQEDFSNEQSRKACVDHNHLTGKIRGLLCWRCNLVLGHVDDAVWLLNRMKNYLLGGHPNTGLTVALADDKRVGVKVKTTTEAFPNAIATTETTNG